MPTPRFKVTGTLGGTHIETNFAFESAIEAKQYIIEHGIDPYNIIDGREK